jgi:hypothetical protein
MNTTKMLSAINSLVIIFFERAKRYNCFLTNEIERCLNFFW